MYLGGVAVLVFWGNRTPDVKMTAQNSQDLAGAKLRMNYDPTHFVVCSLQGCGSSEWLK